MQRHIQHNEDEGHSSLEKYTSHFIWKSSKGLLKVLLCERWVGGWTELQHIDPNSYGHNSVSFPFSWAAQPGAWGPSLSGTCSSFQQLLSKCNCSIGDLRAPFAGCSFSLPHLISTWLNFQCTELYNNLTPTLLPASVTISHSIQPVHGQGYIRMHLLFTQVHFLFWRLGRGQDVTYGAQFTDVSFSMIDPKTLSTWPSLQTAARITLSLPDWFCFFIQWHIDLCMLFNAKAILLKEQ